MNRGGSDDGPRVAIATADDTITMWDLATSSLRQILRVAPAGSPVARRVAHRPLSADPCRRVSRKPWSGRGESRVCCSSACPP